MAVPETHYARNGDVYIAYQSFGDGPVSLIGIPPIVSNIEVLWEHPLPARFLRRLASFSRFVHYDKRGQGMSDRETSSPTIDERLDDLEAVMDAAGIERAALAGISEGGSTGALFAAMHPDRVSHLILIDTFARAVSEEGRPGVPGELWDGYFEAWAASWGTPNTLSIPMVAPTMHGEPGFVEWMNRFERQSTSPGGLLASSRWIRELDLRAAIETIQVPTLVIHRTSDPMVDIAEGRYLAEHIPDAQFVELSGSDHMPWFGDQDSVLDAMEAFLVGQRTAAVDADRMLATVLFTDIVGSTELAASMGDRRWRALLDDHDAAVRAHVQAGRGVVVKHTGDGALATFDGPIRAIRCAQNLCRELSTLGIEIRAGVHTGEVEVRGEDIGGVAVHIGARVGALAGAREVLVSRTVVDLVSGSDMEFVDRGEHILKGVPGEWRLFAVR
ncbi:MAG TPA: adenylate/guanylate cyclase domain-containing protein [Acidimicrobiales bacterium]|nr:adenylate/guanylate cyclase domain-containing protein [Acidimicrobiales bacterium]